MYTNKPAGKLNKDGLSILRNLIVGELNAVDTYKMHLLQSDNQTLNDIIEEILSDEERHIKMLEEIIKKYDPKQEEYFEDAKEELPKINNYGNNYVSKDYNIVHSLINEIKSELEAINHYESSTMLFSIPEIKMTLTELMNDEKQHMAELSKILDDVSK